MTGLPPLPGDQRKIDAGHLNLLAIFHFIGAGLALLGILFLLAHFAIFHAVTANHSFLGDPKFVGNQQGGRRRRNSSPSSNGFIWSRASGFWAPAF